MQNGLMSDADAVNSVRAREKPWRLFESEDRHQRAASPHGGDVFL